MVDDLIMWLGRLVKFLPVFQDLWRAVEGNNTNRTHAQTLELVRQMREQQAREAFDLSEPSLDDEGTGS